MLQQGYTFSDAFTMIQGNPVLLQELEQGTPLVELLIQGHHGSFYDHLCFFMKIASLSEAIMSALEMDDVIKSMRSRLMKQSRYPMLLFIMALFTLYLFTAQILPQLMQGFAMNEENGMWLGSVYVLRTLALSVLCTVTLALMITLIASRSLRWKLHILSWLRFTSLPQQYCSYLLAGYFAQLLHHGITTKNAFAFLTQLKNDSLLRQCACQMEAQLQDGLSLDECLSSQCWLDDAFVRMWMIAEHTHNMEASLKQYQKQQEATWEQLLKRIGIGIQISTYLFVGIMVILVYQIMLVPLQMMESM